MLSLSDHESSYANSLRELLDYVSDLGEHINHIYKRLEKIDMSLHETKEDLLASIQSNENELESIKETMITKSEFNSLLEKINEPFQKFSPPKAPPMSHENEL